MTVWVVWGGAFWFWLGTHVSCGKLYDGREGAASNVLSFPLHLGSTLHFATRLAWGSSDLHVNMETPKNSPCSATSLEYDEAHCQVRPLEVFVVSVSVVNVGVISCKLHHQGPIKVITSSKCMLQSNYMSI
jgi:hypothetical protein